MRPKRMRLPPIGASLSTATLSAAASAASAVAEPSASVFLDGGGGGPSVEAVLGPLLALAFLGQGLLPSLRTANTQALASLGDRTERLSERTAAAEAGGVVMPCSRWLGYPAPLYADDVLDAVSRLEPGDTLGTAAGRLIRRAEFEALLAARPAQTTTLHGIDGAPLTNGAVRSTWAPSQAPPSALAMEATWTALSGGSPYVAPEEVARQLSRWRPQPSVFVLDEFERSLLQGRAAIASGYAILFGLQALVLVVFVAQPLWKAVAG